MFKFNLGLVLRTKIDGFQDPFQRPVGSVPRFWGEKICTENKSTRCICTVCDGGVMNSIKNMKVTTFWILIYSANRTTCQLAA